MSECTRGPLVDGYIGQAEISNFAKKKRNSVECHGDRVTFEASLLNAM